MAELRKSSYLPYVFLCVKKEENKYGNKKQFISGSEEKLWDIPWFLVSVAFCPRYPLWRQWLLSMLSMVREIVFGVGFALLLPGFFGLDGVLNSMPVSDILTFIISVIIIAATYKQLEGSSSGSVSSVDKGVMKEVY